MDEQQTPVWSVTELNNVIRDLIENTFLPVCVTGEISGITLHRSGHVYLTLKDANSQIRAVWFNGAAKCAALKIENGAQVEARGKIAFYAQRGECQLNLTDMKPLGAGTLQQKFEELKRKLAAEGLFDPARKKPLPFIPRCIGIVTSPEGAAVKDFIKVALERFPPLRIRVFPAAVQGKGAEFTLANGVRFFNQVRGVDVILVTRGGGSIEDLWPFNEEVLARAIAASAKPVVSAVGHEIDFTISDMAADVRAPTPTAAAEVLLPDYSLLLRDISDGRRRLLNGVSLSYERCKSRLDRALSARALSKPAQMLLERSQSIDLTVRDMESMLKQAAADSQARLERTAAMLSNLNPRRVLERGYSILLNPAGKAVLSPEDAPSGTELAASLAKGSIRVKSL